MPTMLRPGRTIQHHAPECRVIGEVYATVGTLTLLRGAPCGHGYAPVVTQAAGLLVLGQRIPVDDPGRQWNGDGFGRIPHEV
ncbi:hypothetical protein ACVWZK_002941 [Bradyrhizobium sp. GM0.4]